MFKAILTYDGTRYFGWQKTKNGPAIQGELEKAIALVTGESTMPEAASRTDRGVHAKAQVVQFALKNQVQPHRLQRALNALLPSDIRVLEMVLEEFHPTLDAKCKEYHYNLDIGPVQDPIRRLYSWHFYYPIDLVKMKIATLDLIGTHDFTAFSNIEEKNPICTVESIIFDGHFVVKGNRFLYKMVRNIVGTLVYIGCGKLPPGCIPEILQSKDRKKAGVTAPAHGLYLHEVFY